MSHAIQCPYSRYVFEAKTYTRALDVLANAIKSTPGLDAIAFRGASGAALAFPLWLHTGVPLIHSRKPGSHSSYLIEGRIDAKRYCIVDDFIETGSTVNEIIRTVNEGYSAAGQLETPVLTDIFLTGNSSPKDDWCDKWPGVKIHCFASKIFER